MHKVYIMVPANVATGGVEDTYQLAYDLRELYPVDVLLYYPSFSERHPVPDSYAHYNLPYTYEIEDSKNNIFIIPETSTTRFDKLKKIRKVIWWLSVDNYYLSYDYFLQSKWKGKLNRWLWKHDLPFVFFNEDLKKIKLHLAQSYYALSHLRSKGIEAKMLPDHINQEFLDYKPTEKKNIVAYNPKKGFAFTKKLIEASPDITFVPIINMKREQVVELLKSAKVYIDFGNHPGRDKIPREAAILGCCVITNKRGSAGFWEDVPIPFKTTDIQFIRDVIKYYFDCYELGTKDFDLYRRRIRNEREVYLLCITEIFSSL